MAAGLAARLKSEGHPEVAMVPGGLGEFTVLVDGETTVKTSRFWYPRSSEVYRTVKARLSR